MKDRILKIQAFAKRHEEALLPLFLLFGFAVDSITLRRVDLLPETLLVYGYLLLSGLAIYLSHLYEEKVWKGDLAERAAPFLPLVLQYAFGSLFSAFVIFYVKSASIADSWPFIIVLLSVIIGVEVLKKYPHRFVFNLAIYFLALFSFAIFAVPLWVGEIGTHIFALSAVFAAAVFSVFVYALFLTGKSRIEGSAKSLAASVAALILIVTTLYASNLLPPIPLALKDIGVFHSVTRENGGYRVVGERYFFLDRIWGMTVHLSPGEPVYVFSSVFTPVAIKTDIVHRWEKWDAEEDDWVRVSEISFAARGGRDEGYRGFSVSHNALPGLWRVSVETPDGLKIGRLEFTVVHSETPPELISEVR